MREYVAAGQLSGEVPVRDLIVTENITLDGVIDAREGWFAPAGGKVDLSDLEAALTRQRESADAVLFGRKTFEQMRSYWPKQTNDTTGISAYLNRTTKYVVSSTLRDPTWEHSTVLQRLDDVRALKTQPGRDIVTTGSITLAHALIGAGLVDEYRLFIYPIVLGQGARLFSDQKLPRLQLMECRTFRSGIMLCRYRSA